MANDKALARPAPPPGMMESIDNMALAGRARTVPTIDNEHEVRAYLRDVADAEIAKEEKQQHWAVEIAEPFVALGAGTLSNVTMGGFPLGAWANAVVGTAAKIGSIVTPEHKALRVVCRAGKTLLHSQIAISTRDHLRGSKP